MRSSGQATTPPNAVIGLTGYRAGGTIRPTGPETRGDELRLRDAKDQIERDRPELTGTAKIEAIKALRASDAEQKKAPPDVGRHCVRCDQDVKPVHKRGWAALFSWLTLLEFGSVIVAIVAAFTTVDPDSLGGGTGLLIFWPAAVRPAWLSIVASLAAFVVVASLSGAAGQRAAADATCPKCGLRLSAADT
ncbi:hypothetical protein SGPA1_10867 [Streptomyces misionensis JCM 4497]